LNEGLKGEKAMKNVISAIISFSFILFGCMKTRQEISNTPKLEDNEIPIEEVHQLASYSTLTEEPQNPNGDLAFTYLAINTRELILLAEIPNWGLIVGGDAPTSYESLLEKGALSVIFKNRYTGEDIRITDEYSPGDFNVHYPTPDDPAYNFWTYYGEEDYSYDPSVALPGERHHVAGVGGPDYTTDGRTGYIDHVVSNMAAYTSGPVDSNREIYNIPPDDEARARMMILSVAVHTIMRYGTSWLESVPDSVDGYIELVGRKNPVAWVNPYTGQDISEVPWVEVPLFQEATPVNEPSLGFAQSDDTTGLAGNYSFAMGIEKNYAQFYFLMADGSVGAYIAFAERPQG
jgi:hypothetical protein